MTGLPVRDVKALRPKFYDFGENRKLSKATESAFDNFR